MFYFWQDLTSFVSELHGNNTTVILGIDENSDLNDNNSKVKQFMKSTGMVDVIDNVTPEQIHIPTFLRGKRRIDEILVSSSLCSSLIDISHTDINDHVDTDNIGITATLNKIQFCNRKTSHTIKMRRTVTITNTNNIMLYNQNVLK